MVIAFKPLHDGESLQSNLSRYAREVGLKTYRSVYTHVFGENACCHNRLLPTGINRFCEEGRDYWNKTTEEFVRDHTPYHYFTLLGDAESRGYELARMLGAPGSSVSKLSARRKGEKGRFTVRYCDECVAICRKCGIEPYFHVIHQLPNVFICPSHGVSLRCIDLDPTYHTRAHAVTLADYATSKDRRLMDEYPSTSMAAAVDVARRSAHVVKSFDEDFINFPYEEMFREAGLSLQSGCLNHAKLWDALSSYYGEKFCSDTGIERSAMSRKFWGRETAKRFCPRPFRYLALQSFLAYRASLGGSVGLGSSRRTHLGEHNAPLCCQPTLRQRRGALEVTCESDLKMLTERFACSGKCHRPDDRYARIELNESTGSLIFSCTCDRQISVAFDKSGSEQAIKVLQYGTPCVKAFEQLVGRGLTPFAAAAQLEVSGTVAYLWERRIAGLKRSVKISAQMVEENRNQWSVACAQLPTEFGFMNLRQQLPSTYSFLVRNDGAWLREFNKKFSDARKSHLELSQCQLLTAAKERLTATNPPVWMCRAAIWAEAGLKRRTPLVSSAARRLVSRLVERGFDYRERVLAFWMKELGADAQVHYWSFLKRCHIADCTLTTEQRMRTKAWLSARGDALPTDDTSDESTRLAHNAS